MATGLSTIHLYHYNNYYNRIQKRFATVKEYADYELTENGTTVSPIKGVSFNSGNMVDTNQVVNRVSFEVSGAPDYAIVVNEDDPTQWTRWFVIACTRLRAEQYNLTLRRDLISDYYNDVIESDCFIEKGACAIDDHAIYNKDITTPNLIKTYEDYVYDHTRIPWHVAYIPRDSFKIGGTSQYKDKLTVVKNNTEQSSIFNIAASDDTTVEFVGDTGSFEDYPNTDNPKLAGYKLKPGVYTVTLSKSASSSTLGYPLYVSNYGSTYVTKVSKTYNTTSISFSGYDSNGVEDTYTIEMPIPDNRIHANQLPYDIITAPADWAIITVNGNPIECDPKIELGMITNIAVGFDISTDTSSGVGTVYDVQTVPFCPDKNIFTRNEYSNIQKTNITKLYAPKLTNDSTEYTVVYIKNSSNQIKGILYFIGNDYSSETLTLDRAVSPDYNASSKAYFESGKYDVKSVKRMTNLTSFRLASPDYTSIYSFNPAAVSASGLKDLIERQTLKPFSPTITIYPDYEGTYVENKYSGGLYGDITKDQKCLICTGSSFSIPQVTSTWAQYQLSNSNYQSAFNRQIDDMEVNKSVEQTNDIMSTIASTISGAATGALSGAMATKLPVGAVVGGVIGGTASLAAGTTQTVLNQQMAQREIDTAKIQFNYSIQNIKAQPYTLTNTGNNSPLNYHLPRLEYYTASSTDYANYDKTIALNGMTLNRPGKIADSITAGNPFDTTKTYVLGNLINLNTDTSHSLSFEQVEAIAHEIARGQYYE